MDNKLHTKSITLTHLMVRSFYFVMAAVVALGFIFKTAVLNLPGFFVPLYISLPIGLVALICLDMLLCNIKKSIVFDAKNITLLNVLSLSCFLASLISMLSFVIILAANWNDDFSFFMVIYSIFPIMSIGEAFVGLVVRVVKNSFEKAIEIKNENDLTI